MFCKYCGKKIESDSIFCSHFGKEINKVVGEINTKNNIDFQPDSQVIKI